MNEHTQAKEGFAATVDHVVRMARKRDKLIEAIDEAVAVLVDLSSGTHRDEIADAYEQLKAANVRGRVALRYSGKRQASPGEVFRRERGEGSVWPTAPAWVYVLWDDDDRICYIGMTAQKKLCDRMQGHRAKPWSYLMMRACESEAEALRLEGDLIFQHRPYLNKVGLVARRFVA